jgi:hypothetical protein
MHDLTSTAAATPPRRRLPRPLLHGALGAGAAVGLLLATPLLAGASGGDEPDTAPATNIIGDGAVNFGGSLDPEHAAWNECLGEHLGLPADPADSEATFVEIDPDAADAADEACAELMPEEVRAQQHAFAEFDRCMNENAPGLLGAPAGATVIVIGPDGASEQVAFTDTPGTVTVTGTADGVQVTTDGGVDPVTEDELAAAAEQFQAQFEACEALLPDQPGLDVGIAGSGPVPAVAMEG